MVQIGGDCVLKYPCLVLDHDDTVVRSEVTVNYPCFLRALEKFRPGETMDYPEFVDWCFRHEFTDFLRIKYQFTEEELQEEYRMWQEYSKTRIPPAYEGIREIILEQKKRGGLVCVASLSSREMIERDYDLYIGIRPDLIFCKDDPICKPDPYPLNTIMETYHLSPADLLMVDDLKTGLQMAKAANVSIAAALWCRQDSPEIIEYMTERCDFAFHTTKELYEFLFTP
jgi:phosphoglycolate phosphatase/pyrophosphatase PpaX